MECEINEYIALDVLPTYYAFNQLNWGFYYGILISIKMIWTHVHTNLIKFYSYFMLLLFGFKVIIHTRSYNDYFPMAKNLSDLCSKVY